jgi:hypothetical protein
VNGGQDFDQDLLDEIYNGIKWVVSTSCSFAAPAPPPFISLLFF